MAAEDESRERFIAEVEEMLAGLDQEARLRVIYGAIADLQHNINAAMAKQVMMLRYAWDYARSLGLIEDE